MIMYATERSSLSGVVSYDHGVGGGFVGVEAGEEDVEEEHGQRQQERDDAGADEELKKLGRFSFVETT
jgi:hypothetical protein